MTRRFCCEAPQCPRRIFAERFEEAVLPVRARRTARLEGLVHHLGPALGGRPAASFAKRLMLPVSNDTLLRVVIVLAPTGAGKPASWAFTQATVRNACNLFVVVEDLPAVKGRTLPLPPSGVLNIAQAHP